MSKECSKSLARRLSNPNFMRLYFKGNGIDIGGKSDPLSLYIELFPLVKSIRTWDIEDGDAQFMSSVESETYDFVHSSHCLEHLNDPLEGIQNWLRILKPGGYLIITVPDEDLYEQGKFPSTFNKDHKWTFTVYKYSSWSTKSINIIDMLKDLDDNTCIEKIELLNSMHRILPRYDQTLTPVAECGIEVIIRKRTYEEISNKGKLPKNILLNKEVRVYLNQYRDDQNTLIQYNKITKPFNNESNI
uniref:Putative methyltransferase n=1 Tax=viral metagenome TaxID=1070528 RepID=A0A6H1ZKH8_9ZZZZ